MIIFFFIIYLNKKIKFEYHFWFYFDQKNLKNTLIKIKIKFIKKR